MMHPHHAGTGSPADGEDGMARNHARPLCFLIILGLALGLAPGSPACKGECCGVASIPSEIVPACCTPGADGPCTIVSHEAVASHRTSGDQALDPSFAVAPVEITPVEIRSEYFRRESSGSLLVCPPHLEILHAQLLI